MEMRATKAAHMAKHHILGAEPALQKQVRLCCKNRQILTMHEQAWGRLKAEPLEVGSRFVAVLSQICLAYA
jgi:hypothetical protein